MKCVHCSLDKQESDFYYHQFQLDWCSACRKNFREEWQKYRKRYVNKNYSLRHSVKVRQNKRRYDLLHPEKKKQRNNEFRRKHPFYMKEWHEKHPGYNQRRKKKV